MKLDEYKLQNVTFQVTYPQAFELWDRAGRIARRMTEIWGPLKISEGRPNQQQLDGGNVTILTTMQHSLVTVRDPQAFDALHTRKISESLTVWREELQLSTFDRVSTRAKLVKSHKTLGEANAAVLSSGTVNLPSEKVFGQSQNSEDNGIAVSFRFEDKESFAFLRLEAEKLPMEVNLDADFFPEIGNSTRHRYFSVIDFDRGLFGQTVAEKFRMDDWMRGFMHLLRRDFSKIVRLGVEG